MITCQKCGHANVLGTVFCRSCGIRLVVDYADIERSVAGKRAADRDDRVFRWGRSAVGLCSFLLVCALILRYVMVPAMPTLELPPPPAAPWFTKEPPPWADHVLAAGAPTTASALAAGSRLAWRHDHATAVFAGVGIDAARVRAWQAALLADQQADGSFTGGDPLAATALAATALQAAPLDDAGIDGARRARAWLGQHGDGITQKPALTRTLYALALLDAEQLPLVQGAALGVYLVDGGAPLWQAYLLALHPVAQRPQAPAVRSALSAPWWGDFFALLAGLPAKPDLSHAAATAPATGEERMAWAFAAWQRPVAPKELCATLHAWCAADPAPVAAGLSQACGQHAAEAVAALTVCAPLRVPPLWLQR